MTARLIIIFDDHFAEADRAKHIRWRAEKSSAATTRRSKQAD
jgi:hypothetical protein